MVDFENSTDRDFTDNTEASLDTGVEDESRLMNPFSPCPDHLTNDRSSVPVLRVISTSPFSIPLEMPAPPSAKRNTRSAAAAGEKRAR